MATTDPLIGKKLGDYTIVDVLGRGGMARVYRGYDSKLNRYAAVKINEPHMLPESDQEEYRKRFLNEARSIAKLQHPNIVGIYQFDQVGTLYFMAMAFVEGRDLRHIIKNHAQTGTYMPFVDVLRVVRDTAAALDYAHQKGVIHRDVKPSNIMVTPDGRAVLTDFGLALSVQEGTIGSTFGSAHYIAPEQAISSAQAVSQSDLYSLGVVLYEMLTNRVPFNDPSAMSVAMKHIGEQPERPSVHNPNLTAAVDDVVMKALEKEPQRRFASGYEMTQALEAALAQSGVDLSSYRASLPPPIINSPSQGTAPTGLGRSGLRLGEKTPELVALDDDTPTVSDSRRSRPSAATKPDVTGVSSRRLPLLLLGVVLLAGLVGGALLLTAQQRADLEAAQTATAVANAGVMLLATETENAAALSATRTAAVIAPEATETPSDSAAVQPNATKAPTDTPTARPTDTPTTAPPTATAAPTSSPTQRASIVFTVTAVVPAANDSPVLLRYDSDSLVLFNRSDGPVDVSDWTFVQRRASGTPLEYDTRFWERGGRSTSALPAGQCFQVFRLDAPVTDEPDYCQRRQAWSQVGPLRTFWLSSDPAAAFEVRRGGEVLATCLVKAGECAVNAS